MLYLLPCREFNLGSRRGIASCALASSDATLTTVIMAICGTKADHLGAIVFVFICQ